jgi:hypothetical protein
MSLALYRDIDLRHPAAVEKKIVGKKDKIFFTKNLSDNGHIRPFTQ